jgi:SHS2 domain-containing protein
VSEANFTEFEHTGDVGIEVDAASRPALFSCALVAIARLMVAGGAIRALETRIVSASADNDVDLIHDLLTAALNLFLVDEFIWREASVTATGDGLIAHLAGERFDRSRHEFRGEIKAVTYHQLTVAQDKTGDWRARIIFDR